MSEYVNGTAIDCEMMVLDLLYTDRWEHHAERTLYVPPRSYRGALYVRVSHSEYRVDDYLIGDGIGERLLSQYLVQGTKHWGYTDNHELRISDDGRSAVRKAYEDIDVRYDERFTQRLRTERWFTRA